MKSWGRATYLNFQLIPNPCFHNTSKSYAFWYESSVSCDRGFCFEKKREQQSCSLIKSAHPPKTEDNLLLKAGGLHPKILCAPNFLLHAQGGLHSCKSESESLIKDCSGYLSPWLSRCTDRYILCILILNILLLGFKIFNIKFFFNF